MSYETLNKFLPAIKSLQLNKPFTKEDLLTERFLVEQEAHIKMYYAPHNEYVNKRATIVIVGITPGWQQMNIAFKEFVQSQVANDTLETSLYNAKVAARFSGTMRNNLIKMLDQCYLPEILNIPSLQSLFAKNNKLLHTTSIIKYPVFVHGKNYTGHQPRIEQSALLKHYAYHSFPAEMDRMDKSVLVIPLGKTVDQIILKLVAERKLPNHHCYVTGFPHPSGANGHRIRQFQEEKQQICETIKKWAVHAHKATDC